MRVLAIDTALGACSACVLERGAAAPLAVETAFMERGHAEELVPLIDRVMARVEERFAGIERIVVTTGPGSFTGLRIGVAAARAMAVALDVPAVGVTTLAALIAPHLAGEGNRVIAAAIDARHGHVYVQAIAPGGRILIPPRIATIREAVRALGSGAISLVGPAAPILAADAQALGLDARVVDAAPAPEIAWVARLGIAADPAESPARPLYLRAPDAKPQDQSRLPRQ